MLTSNIHRIKDGELMTWLADERLPFPNGLTIVGDRMNVTSWGVIDSEGFGTIVPGH